MTENPLVGRRRRIADNDRMRNQAGLLSSFILLVLVAGLADGQPSAASAAPTFGWRTVGRGKSGNDSLFVRALRSVEEDSSESTFVKYQIEDSRGRVLHADTLSDGGWCESLVAEFKPWRSGVRVEMVGVFYPCPDECASTRHVYLAADTAAVSEWNWQAWIDVRFDERGRAEAWISEHGAYWRAPLEVVIDRARLTFGVDVSETALQGNPILVSVRGHNCLPRQRGDDSLITMFPSSTSNSGRSVIIPLGTEPRFLSGVARVDRTIQGDELPHLVRVEVQFAKQRGWVDVGDLEVFGCGEP